MAEKAPKGRYPWQRGDMHPPTDVVLVYGVEEIPVETVWHGWQGATRIQNFSVVAPERIGLPTALKAHYWPGKTGLLFPMSYMPRVHQRKD